jgi:hypothetical protein
METMQVAIDAARIRVAAALEGQDASHDMEASQTKVAAALVSNASSL